MHREAEMCGYQSKARCSSGRRGGKGCGEPGETWPWVSQSLCQQQETPAPLGWYW